MAVQKSHYAVVGEDYGVCPASLGRYEIERFADLDEARERRKEHAKREAESGDPRKDVILIREITYNIVGGSGRACGCDRGACEGHVDWWSEPVVDGKGKSVDKQKRA